MYLTRLQLANYGPLRNLDLHFPFDGDRPKPVLLVGENGSGKTIVLSHIVNAMVMAKDSVYPDSRELDAGRVFKLRSSSYISVEAEYYYARCDFRPEYFIQELRLRKPKGEYTQAPMTDGNPGFDAWEAHFDNEEMDHFKSNILDPSHSTAVKNIISENCLLYFPSNRTEEPAWLNEGNLRAKPHYTQGSRLKGETRRRLIAHSPLRDIHDWLYDVVYDRAAFEIHSGNFPIALPATSDKEQKQTTTLPLFLGYQGDATNMYNSVLEVLRAVMPELAAKRNLRFGIGGRHNRVISLEGDQQPLVPNLFQLSSGEMTLLTLFFSILRDFDLREARNMPFTSIENVKGVVVVDEVDLHLHARHQHDILPTLIRMFPQIQFVMTTHSVLFALGMAKVFGDDGFEIYDLPSGSRISPEEFDEFDQAFQAYKDTTRFSNEVRYLVENAQHLMIIVEGETDRDYLRSAATFLGKNDVLEKFEIECSGGNGNLKMMWTSLKKLVNFGTLSEKTIILLHDPESQDREDKEASIYKRKMPYFQNHPIKKGVENLFDRTTLERARKHHPKFIDIASSHARTIRGRQEQVPECWSVNKDEKRNLCDWLRNEGTDQDFRHFEKVFDILEEIVQTLEPLPTDMGSEAIP